MARRSAAVLVCGLVLAAAGLWPAHAGDPPAAAEASLDRGLDPVVAEVLRMLQGGVSAALVLHWLDASGARPASVPPDAIIALTRDGASDELIRRMIDLAAEPRVDSAALPAGSERGRGSATAPRDAAGCCMVDVSITYRPQEPLEGEQRRRSRDLYVYLDGWFLARVESQTDVLGARPLQFRTLVPQGTHAIRLLRELHLEAGRRDDAPTWTHEAWVSPDAIDFEIDRPANWNLELGWTESAFLTRRAGPLGWRLLADGSETAGSRDGGAPKEEWRHLCEDLELNSAQGHKLGFRARKALDDCVRWPALWDGASPMPSRAELLEGLARHGFAPPPGALARPDEAVRAPSR